MDGKKAVEAVTRSVHKFLLSQVPAQPEQRFQPQTPLAASIASLPWSRWVAAARVPAR